MKKIIMAVPKGRILDELNPILKRIGILPEEDFYSHDSRKLMFETNLKFLNIIRVRSFDVATFVALGAAQIGIAGDDVLNVGSTTYEGGQAYSVRCIKDSE